MTAAELYADLTNKIVASLESGNLPIWRQPWSGGKAGFLPLRHNGLHYRGVNVLILAIEGMAQGYASQTWMTLKQANELGGYVRKGERSTVILFCQPMTKNTTRPDGTEGKEGFWISKTYRVFNACQCDGLPDRFLTRSEHQLDEAQRVAHADAFLNNLGAEIHHGGSSAFYHPVLDYISLPGFTTFDRSEAYYSTALHEASHWTGHGSRLNRDLKGYGASKADYCREEIVAELASVFVCANLGIAPPDLGQHAAYIEHWTKALKEDPRCIFTAASKAQAAADYLLSLQPTT